MEKPYNLPRHNYHREMKKTEKKKNEVAKNLPYVYGICNETFDSFQIRLQKKLNKKNKTNGKS